jgi:hypothetical protein
LFRDAKQSTGLTHCQSLRQDALDFHFNASMATLNLMKIEDRQDKKNNQRGVISIANWKIRKTNEMTLRFFSSTLGLDLKAIKSNPCYENLRNYGAIAA